MDSAPSAGQSRWRRAPVLIIGAHRSGTTATARALELLGLQIGQRLDSHRESKALQRLHEEYLQQLGAAWHSPAAFLERVETPEGERHCVEFLRENIRQQFAHTFGYRRNPRGLWLLARLKLGAPWGWKEPRTTLFAPLWLQLFPGARVIDVIRHPLAVAMSIRQRELEFRAAGDPPTGRLDELDCCLRLALTYIELGEGLAGRAAHYRRIRFEDIQANASQMLADLADFCDLRFTQKRMSKSVATIRRESSSAWDNLSEETARELLSSYPAVTKLGYGWQKRVGALAREDRHPI